MTWTIGWLLFGLLAVRETTELAATPDSGWSIVLCLVYGLLAAAMLFGRCQRSVRRGRPMALYQLCALCLVGLAAIAWRLHDGTAGATEIRALLAAAAIFSLSLVAAALCLPLCWRVRLRRRQLRREQRALGDHRDRVERMGMPIAAEFAAMGLRLEDDPWPASFGPEDLLTARDLPAPHR